MPAYATETIVWTCIAAFIVCMGAGLLIVTGKWQPKDPEVRKWLLRTVVFVAVGAVVTFAAQLFSQGGRKPDSQVDIPAGGSVGKGPSEQKPGAVGVPTPPAGQPPIEKFPEQVNRPVAQIPEDIARWATTELGERPLFSMKTAYPDCVATLRAQEVVSRSEARRCRTVLEQLHLTSIVGYYNVKRAYDMRLEQQEQALRGGSIQDDELPRYNYVIGEMERLNGDASEEIASVHRAEEMLLEDIQACRQSLCQAGN